MESKCPAGRMYEFVDIRWRTKQKAVKCLFKGNIHNQETIRFYCTGVFSLCPVYQRYGKGSSGNAGDRGGGGGG